MPANQIGASKWDLDTPALCVDLVRLDDNIAKPQTVVTGNGIAARPHAKPHEAVWPITARGQSQ
jgi:D-serine deaminase-like pyridoxal phosphate-dependent protein